MTDQILAQMGYTEAPLSISPFISEEDGGTYEVWRVEFPGQTCVLKKAKGYEADTFRYFFSTETPFAPHLLGTAAEGDREYLLMEYIDGDDLRQCRRESLQRVLDALIAMQRRWWQHPAPEKGFHYSQSLPGREKRLDYLKDPQLEAAYQEYLRIYQTVPRTLCHDDLLPFNIICNEKRAVFIDWEYGGILPYLTSLARLIAHTEESSDAFFYMSEADRAFAIDYYFEHFVREMGISLEEYRNALDNFLFYEYCEWVYVGNLYNDNDSPRYQSYVKKAKALAIRLRR